VDSDAGGGLRNLTSWCRTRSN